MKKLNEPDGGKMEKKQIKILHIFSGVGGGISTWIRKAAMYSNVNSCKTVNDAMAFSISNKSNFIDIIEANGGKCLEMPRLKAGFIKLIRYISSSIRNENYDIVHCHIDGIQAVPIWLAVCVLAKKPLIIHSHRTAIEKIAGKPYERMVYRLNRIVNKMIARNKIACGEKAKSFAFGKANDVEILYNGINAAHLYEHTSIDEECDEIVLLALGRLSKVKNHEFMVKVVKRLIDKGINAHLYIVGDGELRDTIIQSILNNKLSNYVSLEGYCDTPDIYLELSDTLLMPSYSEGLPTVMIEAQEHRCKVISSNRVTNECDLNLGMVSFLDIGEEHIDAWVDQIIENGKKQHDISLDIINRKLRDKGFLNETIYENYSKYVSKIMEE